MIDISHGAHFCATPPPSEGLHYCDGGKTWSETQLGDDHGNYSFRLWQTGFKPPPPGDYQLMCMAINRNGETQRDTPRWNPSGYMRNVIETVRVQVA
jgi:hypothetical protein